MAEAEGNLLAVTDLGAMYERGLGVEMDLPRALANFLQAGCCGVWVGYHNAYSLIFDRLDLDPGSMLFGEALRALVADGGRIDRETYLDYLIGGRMPELAEGEREAGRYFGPYALAQQRWAEGDEAGATRLARTARALAGAERYPNTGHSPRDYAGWLIQNLAAQGAKFTSTEVAAVLEEVGPPPEGE